MNRTLFVVLLLAMAACGTIPQSANEFREMFRSSSPLGATRAERTIDRPLQRVLADVRANSDKCFNVVTKHSGPSSAGFGQARLSITYRSTTTSTSSTTGEMIVRMIVPAAGRQPEGGYFAVLGDMAALSPTKTRLTVYGSNGSSWSEPIESVFAWAGGTARSCPEMP